VAEGSLLLLEEYFAAGAPQFLDELLKVHAAKKLGPFAERWFKDPRPWARGQLHAYLDRPFNTPGHEPLVKRLFKQAEAAGDDASMARFLAAFDRGVRRKKTKRYDASSRQIEEVPKTPRVTIPRENFGWHLLHPETRLFSVHTRRYLQRRAWRYFRRLGARDPKRYRAAILEALPLYRDEDVDDGIHFLDNWGLVHVLFHHSDVVWARPHGWFVRGGRALRELKPAPAFPAAWDADLVLATLLAARARPVRRAAMAMLKARPELLEKLPFGRVLEMLEHGDAEVQALGVEALEKAQGLESAPLDLWIRLLEGRNLAVLEAVCGMMGRVVHPDRLSTEQLLRFACGPLGPVARFGLEGLRARTLPPAGWTALAGVRAASVAKDAVALARERMGAAPDFDPEGLLAFLDAPLRETREAAWAWFSDEKRARHRLDLWAKLVENPYDDVRLSIVRHLEQFASIDTALRVLLARAPLETVWATVLLNIHRGSRAKRLAARQVAEAIERDPARAPQLLPLLAVAARSIRAPEFRAGLAAIVRTAVRRPEVAESVAKHFPELQLAL
jgi:hypothetical protein